MRYRLGRLNRQLIYAQWGPAPDVNDCLEVVCLSHFMAERVMRALNASQFEPVPDPSNDATGAFEPAYYWMHECGYVHAWSASQMAEQLASDAPGGCDACESGSDNAADWTPLYRPVKR